MIYKKVIKGLLLLIFGLAYLTTQAQNNYSNIKVDQLTDNQVRQLMLTGDAAGYNDAQLSRMFIQQGMPLAEVEKLRKRIGRLRSSDAVPEAKQQGERSVIIDTTNYTPQAPTADKGPKIFGADLFKNSKISFEPNLRMTTPKSYVVGPDDELLVDLSGNNEANYNLKVSPEGTIRLQYVGIIAVSGLTIEQATSKIRRAMTKTYPALLNGQTTVVVTLGNIRGIKVTLIGEIVKPGTYTLPSLATVFNALYASGGPNNNGSFRNIQLIRNNRVIATIDVYDFLLKGIQNNARLQDQDVINIPVFKTRVEISGQVKRPALFEVNETEHLQDVINFAGGFTSQAYTARVKVFKNTDRARKLSDIAKEDLVSYKPSNGDTYVVDGILDRVENQVEINGAVFRPGKFELEKGMTLKDLIAKADGIKEDAFLNNAYIYRLNNDNTLSLLSFNVDKVIKGVEPDLPLQREDRVTISSIFDLRDEYQVEIQGEVRKPGTFKYADNMSLASVIQMAGGFKDGATPDRIEISRRVKTGNALSATASTSQIFSVNIDRNLRMTGEPFILQPFDMITVRNAEGYTAQKMVSIEGEVLYPGRYAIQRKDEKISDLVKRAGGLSAMASAEGASLKRPGPTSTSADAKARLLSVQKVQQNGQADSAAISNDPSIIKSDLVGINLPKILEEPNSRYDLLLEEGDIVRVPKQLQTVRVSGEVLKPTNIVYQPGKSLLDYIDEAGGFTYNAKKNGAYVEYANGAIKSTKHVLFYHSYPKVKPGAEVFVPKRPPRERMGLQAFIGIGSALASLAVVIVALVK